MKRTMNRPILVLLLLALACNREQPAAPRAQAPPPPDPRLAEGQQLIVQYGCNVCHIIPGITGPQGALGPSLGGVASRPAISQGAVQNTPANLAKFIQSPGSLNPQSSMPPIGVNEDEAQAITAYLLTLK
jgi:cytochrome c2